MAPLDTELCFARTRRVINARMNHLAVARAGFLSECVVFLKNDDFKASAGQGTGTGQTHHPGTDDNDLDLVSNARNMNMVRLAGI